MDSNTAVPPSAAPPVAEPLPLVEIAATDTAMMEKIYRLRVAAWRSRNKAFPKMERWSDEFDPIGRHWAILDNGEPVAAARLTVHDRLDQVPSGDIYVDLLPDGLPGPIGNMGRLVVAFRFGGRGLAHRLDAIRVAAGRAMGCRRLIGHTTSGPKRIKSATRLGFKVIGEARLHTSGPTMGLPGTRRMRERPEAFVLTYDDEGYCGVSGVA